ncbi:Uncharacterized protein dnm_035080 [Desulfonema magnum]|uniref:Uncharacterized protein n=1 Tax=Desulfonema magnum TaxID=45655 RepID=A0A975BM16_9BACT|nr:Uncharacterized protein dnm_035080 [Desulfonema magnum]
MAGWFLNFLFHHSILFPLFHQGKYSDISFCIFSVIGGCTKNLCPDTYHHKPGYGV